MEGNLEHSHVWGAAWEQEIKTQESTEEREDHMKTPEEGCLQATDRGLRTNNRGKALVVVGFQPPELLGINFCYLTTAPLKQN